MNNINRNIPVIYFIRNNINLKSYIGSAINVRLRINNHKSSLRRNKHYNTHLQNAVNKYGIENFTFDILETINDKNKLLERENFWIRDCQSDNAIYGYNLRPDATSNLGMKQSEKAKSIISLKAKNRKRKPFSEEWKINIGLANLGRINTDETKALMSKSAKERWDKNENNWPHELGCKCECEECRQRRKDEARLWYSNFYNRTPKVKRNLNKWPHELGSKCKCKECIQKKRDYQNNRNKNIRLSK